MAKGKDVVVGLDKIVLKLIDIVFISRIMNVDEMVRDMNPMDIVFGEVLSAANIHSTEHLTRIRADDFTLQAIGKFHSKPCFTTGRGSGDGEQRIHLQSTKKSLPSCLSNSY